jgi:transcription-repair coupling factor (superfamily II helicase)
MSNLSKLLSLVELMPAYRRLIEGLQQRESRATVVLDAAKPYLAVALYRQLQRPVLLITAQPENARKLQEQMTIWAAAPGQGKNNIWLFPELDLLPYEHLTSDNATALDRLRVLAALTAKDDEAESPPPLVIASVAALISKTVIRSMFETACQSISLGMDLDPHRLLADWQGIGYRLENIVEVPGTLSRRGGIIDIWPVTSDVPVRLEFFGDNIDSLRTFDPATQRSVDNLPSVEVTPATEILIQHRDLGPIDAVLQDLDLAACLPEVKDHFQRDIEMLSEGQMPRDARFYAPFFNSGSLLDYLPRGALIILDEPETLATTFQELDGEAEELRTGKVERGELPSRFPRPYFTWNELATAIDRRQPLSLTAWGTEEPLDFITAPAYAGKLPLLLKRITDLRAEQKRIVIVSHQASRLSELLAEENIVAAPIEMVTDVPGPGQLILVQGSLPEGWVMGGETYLFTDAEIFGFVKQRRLVKKRDVPHQKLMIDVIPDDYVVHIEHGISKFTGVTTLKTAGAEKEYLVLQYAAGDTLYVPTDQIDRVSRYVGVGDRPPVLNRLGTQEWNRTKQKVKEAVELLAQDLLNLYAIREVVPGFAFSHDTLWQREMEAAFPYVETHDQLQAQRDVKEDMEKPRPMDRLVCGDVGYGKTEVAIRAAFKAVMDNRQVAVLVPTTVLAQQHYATFLERLEAFPIKVEVLSRFRSDREQRAVIASLADGTVDICIGTHRLLQKDVIFKNLGLLIIDEEQRFGVSHKEHFKKLRREVDVLTLSATPIPRTLHMSLVGVRDMSTMETPPEARLPVKTYVAEYNDQLVREAVLREMERNGQVFFLHNRVQSIAMVAADLRELLPEARIAIGHGQMPEEQLETVMTDFSTGKVDVLVCTTIIESGLDMPNANTLIVNKADKFGLTQLYQLRGRVGRGVNLAYAYFLYGKGQRLSPLAHQRLRTIYEATELGAGFSIAMKDLEIRGAGTLLGAHQSGHITAIGFSLYARLLTEAVEEQKAIAAGIEKPPPRLPPPAVDLPLDTLIPESYVQDIDTRLELYRTLSDLDDPAKLEEMLKEYKDRFGVPPPEVKNLLYAIKIKILAARAGIETITTEQGDIILRRFQGLPFDTELLGSFIGKEIEIGRTQIKLGYRKLGKEWREALEGVVRKLSPVDMGTEKR